MGFSNCHTSCKICNSPQIEALKRLAFSRSCRPRQPSFFGQLLRHASVKAQKGAAQHIAVQPRVLAAMAYQAPSAIALRAARPDSGIRFRSPRLLARSVAIRARALALRLASICSARSKASAVSGDLRIMEFPK
jgi:hypothetical protein